MSVTATPVRNNFRKGKLIFRGFRSTIRQYLHSWQPHTVVEVIYLPNMTREQTGMTGSLSFRALVTAHFCQHVPPCKGSADSQNSTISQGTSLQNVSLGETLQTQTVTQSQPHPQPLAVRWNLDSGIQVWNPAGWLCFATKKENDFRL